MPITTEIFPPFPADLIECRVAGLSQGVDWLNVLYFIGDPTKTYSDNVDELDGTVFTFYEGLAAASLGTFWSVTNATFLDRSVANGQEIVKTPGTAIVGDETAEPLPLQTQLCVTWRTNNSGRRYRGRTFLNGWTVDSNSTTGQPESATIAAVQVIVDDFLTELNGDDQALAILSRGKQYIAPSVPPTPDDSWVGFATPVTAGVVRGGWDVLRSRRT